MGCGSSDSAPPPVPFAGVIDSDLDSKYKPPLGKKKKKNPVVYFSIGVDNDVECGRIEIELKKDKCPKTAKNFLQLCTHKKGYGYKNSFFHRIIPGFMMQGGDFTSFDGRGGHSIWGDKFEDENFDLRHKGPGVLSMANAGPDTNGSQFFLCFDKVSRLNDKHVVFGQVVSGWAVIKALEATGTPSGKPGHVIKVLDCGEVE
jgi:peptidyl-prolyl isomerase E (cyclophilin E)